MSQKKVDAYKARKGLHNKTDRKEKVLFGLEMFAWAFICVVIVAWIGYSAYVKVTGAKENVVQNTVMDTTALDNYISNLSTDASDGTDNCPARAQVLKEAFEERMKLAKIVVLDTAGVSSMYANDGGVIVAV